MKTGSCLGGRAGKTSLSSWRLKLKERLSGSGSVCAAPITSLMRQSTRLPPTGVQLSSLWPSRHSRKLLRDFSALATLRRLEKILLALLHLE